MGIPKETPWDTCRVAFRVESNADSDLTDMIWDKLQRNGNLSGQLPVDWALKETDNSCCQAYVIFEVDGVPTPKDGEAVKAILNSLVQKINKLNP